MSENFKRFLALFRAIPKCPIKPDEPVQIVGDLFERDAAEIEKAKELLKMANIQGWENVSSLPSAIALLPKAVPVKKED